MNISFSFFNEVFQPPGEQAETEKAKLLLPVGWK
jgi:hypothetical protein